MHLPPWREGWISAKRKSPQKSNRMFLLAISLQNAPPLSRSAGFILFWLITSSPEVSKSDEKKEARGGWKKGKAQRNYERANTLVQWITLLYFLVYVWCCCFYSGHSCQQHRRSCQQGEGERESKRHTHRYREGEGARKTPIQKELNWLPSICTDTEHTYLLQTEEEQTTNPDNYLCSVALIFSSLLFNTCSATSLQLF